MVCIVLIMRKLMLYKLPKRLFKFLWILTASRLIIPIWIDAEVKSDSYFYEGMSDISYVSEIPVFPQNPNYTSLEYADVFINLPVAIWIAGCVLVTIFFVCAYFANINKFKKSTNIYCADISKTIQKVVHRNIDLKICKEIKVPISYGILFHELTHITHD